jgi:cell division protein FtsX
MEIIKKESKFIFKKKSFVFMLIATILLFTIFSLFMDNFCKLKKNKTDLSKRVYITIFFNNFTNTDKHFSLVKFIEDTKILILKEYVDEVTAYSKAIERNKFLNELYIPGMEKSLQAYAVVIPKNIPDDTFLFSMNEKLKKNTNIDDVVYNKDIFNEYVFISKQFKFYKKILYFCVLLVLIMFIYKCFFIKKHFFIKKTLYYFISSIIFFFILKITSIFFKYVLFVNNFVAIQIILFTTIFVIILDNDDIC